MKQETAVEYLIEQMMNGNFESYKTKNKWIINYQADKPNPLQLAKAMEEEQIRDAHFTGSGFNSFNKPEDKINSAYNLAEQYYNETYKK